MARRIARPIGTCRVEGGDLQVTAYTLSDPDHGDGYTLPAFFRRFGRRIHGYVMQGEAGPVFVPHPKYLITGGHDA